MLVAAVFENLEDSLTIDELLELYDGLARLRICGSKPTGANWWLMFSYTSVEYHLL